ncbi:MAG: WG repeat-containing protein [Tannerellaceae bacterium]|jgi:hypothetical protein|nr:WG repeat-containing protein [Tannerellaceae bacterium]
MIRNTVLMLLLATCPLFAERWVVKPVYDEIKPFMGGIAPVRAGGKWGYVRSDGTIILPPAYEAAYPFSEGAAALTAAGNALIAIVDERGKLTQIKDKLSIDPRFPTFNDGLLLVSDGRKWGYLNKAGVIAIDCKYAGAQPFSEGLAAVLFSEYWYYIASDGSTRVRPNDKKEIYWAMGFNEGRAVVLYKNGMGYVDMNGNELSYKFPSLTPPPDAASYKGESLICREGVLNFDQKGRATSFVGKNGATARFMAPVAGEEWPKVVAGADSRYGAVAPGDEPLVALSLSSDTFLSVFGNPALITYTVTNISPSGLGSLEVRLDGRTVAVIPALARGESDELSLPLDKTADREAETRDLHFSFLEYGLPAGGHIATLTLRDRPSIRIEIPLEQVILRNGQTSYNLPVRIVNLSSVPVSKVSVSIGNQNRLIDLGAGGAVEMSFTMPSSALTANVTAKPPRTPHISLSKRISVRRAGQERELPPDTTGLSKQIITK